MHRHARIPAHPAQRGAAIMLMLLILILGAASFLLTKLNKGDARLPGNLVAATELGAVTGALVGYATVNGLCLPCPDTNNDGLAEPGCGTGAPVSGWVPWITLGLGALDAWGHRLRYVVDPDFTGAAPCTITQSLQSDIVMQGRDTAGALYALLPPADNPPAVVIAHGANGYGAVTESGTALPGPPAAHLDEEINRTAVSGLVQRVASDTAPPAQGGPFDDLVDWISLSGLKTQLERVNGGPLPP